MGVGVNVYDVFLGGERWRSCVHRLRLQKKKKLQKFKQGVFDHVHKFETVTWTNEEEKLC